jgi:ATP-dependent exoDNAse (exonuclease V) alpha subunit
MLLRRSLLHTTIARGRQPVVLVGDRKAIAVAVTQVGSLRRVTTLRERLAG